MSADYGFSINVNGNSMAQMKKIEESMGHLGAKADSETHHVESRFGEMGEKIRDVLGEIKPLLLGGLGISALFEGWEFIMKSKEAFEGLEKAVTKVDTVIKSTNFAAGFTSSDIQDQAKAMGEGIVAKRQEILDAQGMLLSFHDIKGAKFTETMSAVADFATFYKEDMTSAALQIGKAINDPLKGMTRLQRMGVEFSETQKEQIKNYVEQGNLIGAQEIILKELRTEFGGQAKAFAQTDAGKVQMAGKQWEELQFQIGEVISKIEVGLVPVFMKVMVVIKEAFNSAPMQFFIEHLGTLVGIALKLLPIWVAYRAIMMATSLVTSVLSFSNGILSLSMGEVTVMTDGASVAFEGLAEAIASTGIGALVVGIGLLVEQLISMNSELNESIDKITNLSKTEELFKNNSTKYREISNRFATSRELGTEGKSELATDAVNAQKEIRENLEKTLKPSFEATQRALAENTAAIKNFHPNKGESGVDASARIEKLGLAGDKLRDALSSQREAVKFSEAQMKNLGSYSSELLKQKGVHLLGGMNTKSTVDQSALNISQLSGAAGGLGQAKVINIHIDTVQKIASVQGENLEKAAGKAVEYIIRTVNNLSYSSGSM